MDSPLSYSKVFHLTRNAHAPYLLNVRGEGGVGVAWPAASSVIKDSTDEWRHLPAGIDAEANYIEHG